MVQQAEDGYKERSFDHSSAATYKHSQQLEQHVKYLYKHKPDQAHDLSSSHEVRLRKKGSVFFQLCNSQKINQTPMEDHISRIFKGARIGPQVFDLCLLLQSGVDRDVGMDLVRVGRIYMVKTCCTELKIIKNLMGKIQTRTFIWHSNVCSICLIFNQVECILNYQSLIQHAQLFTSYLNSGYY